MNLLNSRFPVLLAALSLVLSAAHAQVTVEDAWVRATVPGQTASGAFMRLTAARDMRLVSVRSPVAAVCEIHEMAVVDNVMRMRAIPGLVLPAGKRVELKPGGYHLMLMDLRQQLRANESVEVSLVFEDRDGKRQETRLRMPVRQAATAGHSKGH
jgi:copper(I)-binding protein